MKEQYKYRYTIITVCYNAEAYIEKTIQSLLNQKYSNYEYIIKDGQSNDRTIDIINKIVPKSDNIHIVSSKDKGIYDAMNEAVDMAKGEYVYFLNAGDCFYNDDVLRKTDQFIGDKGFDVVYGNTIQIKGTDYSIRKYGQVCSNRLYFLSGDCICHQAMFAKRELFGEKCFDTRYKVCADKEWQLYQIIINKKRFIPMGFEIATVLVDGFSTNHLYDFENETMHCVEQYCKNTAWIYKCVNRMKHNQICVKFLRKIGNFLFVRSKHE